MTAEWVVPIARVLAGDRAELIAFVRAQPAPFWDRASMVEGWRNREILAHLAGGNDQLVQILLRAAVSGEAPHPSVFAMDTDAENASRIEARASWTIAQLIGELQRDGEEVQELLAQLSETDRDRGFEGFDLTLGQFLRIVEHERHDALHLAQLRAVSA